MNVPVVFQGIKWLPVNDSKNKIFLVYCVQFESHVNETVWASFKNKELLQKQYLMLLSNFYTWQILIWGHKRC